jgi:hypothetical protein
MNDLVLVDICFFLLIMISVDNVDYDFQISSVKVLGLQVSFASQETTLSTFWKQGIF